MKKGLGKKVSRALSKMGKDFKKSPLAKAARGKKVRL